MPELPEVERARRLIQDTCVGYKIAKVITSEDKIVYTGGTDHLGFAKEIEGRTIKACNRKGKTFWMELDGPGRNPLMHFGMTGMIQLKGSEPTWYRRRPKEHTNTWPPRFFKFVLELEPQSGSIGDEPVQLAFLDSRRLGRLRLVAHPVEDSPPVSLLGFDPILSHPSLEEFQKLLSKKKGTTKGMIMDQAFSAGVGNWIADEVLYQARIHPACPVPLLTPTQIRDMHFQLQNVCQTAVDAYSEHSKFPENWLFRWRWSKGKKQERGAKKVKGVDSDPEVEDLKPSGKDFLALPDGKPATIEFIEVGGRTTAVVTELQKMPEGVEIKPKISKGGKGGRSKKKGSDSDDASSDLSEPESAGAESPKKTARKKAAVKKEVKEESESLAGSEEEEVEPVKTTPRQKTMAAKKLTIVDASEVKKPDPPKRKIAATGKKATPNKAPRKSRSKVKLERDSELSDLSD